VSAPAFIPTPYCTIGPFFPWQFSDVHYDLTQCDGRPARGERILLTGRVLELGHQLTQNTILEIWQPDANGIFRSPLDPRYADADPGFFGWGRARTDGDAWYRFITVKPGASCEEDGTVRCPHANVMVLAIGITRNLVTSVFFSDAPDAVSDPVLNCVPKADRRKLFATRDPSLDADGLPAYRFDLILRGESETPFFLD
jgi:protocatechuate 3,4-dioxygenase alpha subunit